jgi:protease-4
MLEKTVKILKNVFIVLVMIQFVPGIIQNTKHLLTDATGAVKEKVGLLVVKGMISDATFYTKRIEAFLKDDEIKGLILRIDSPGGIAGCCDSIFNELKYFRAKKPIVALIENVGASGSYYLAAASNTIIASQASIIGSIGVFMQLTNVRQLLESWHVTHSFIESGKYKTVGSMVNDLTPEGRAYLQKLSDGQYQTFVNTMADARGLKATEHTLWADGQVFTGQQALELKLIDKLGSITDAIEEIKRLANITTDVKVVQVKKNTGLLRKLLAGGDDDSDTTVNSAAATVASFAQQVTEQFIAQQAQSPVQVNL